MDARTETANEAAAPRSDSAPPKTAARRRTLFTWLGAAVAVGAVVYGLYWLLVASHHVKTDDAYVEASSAQVTSLVAGAIISAPVNETQVVKKNDVLAVIDPSDYKLNLAQAEADLSQAQRRVEGYFANNDAQAATAQARSADVDKAQAQLASAQSDAARAATDLARRQALAPAGAVSGDELTAAQNKAGAGPVSP